MLFRSRLWSCKAVDFQQYFKGDFVLSADPGQQIARLDEILGGQFIALKDIPTEEPFFGQLSHLHFYAGANLGAKLHIESVIEQIARGDKVAGIAQVQCLFNQLLGLKAGFIHRVIKGGGLDRLLLNRGRGRRNSVRRDRGNGLSGRRGLGLRGRDGRRLGDNNRRRRDWRRI